MRSHQRVVSQPTDRARRSAAGIPVGCLSKGERSIIISIAAWDDLPQRTHAHGRSSRPSASRCAISKCPTRATGCGTNL